MSWKDVLQGAANGATVVAALAAIGAAVYAALTLQHSAETFKRQMISQRQQAAHSAIQEHMQLRTEHRDIVRIQKEELDGIEEQLDGSGGELEKALNEDDYNLYVNVAEHGIAMSEYVYKLWPKDPGWLNTVASWIGNYEPYLLDIKLDCNDYLDDFVWFIQQVLNKSPEKFCLKGTVPPRN